MRVCFETSLIRPLSCGGFGSSEQLDSPLEMMYNREIRKVCLETHDDALEASCSSDGMLNGNTLSSPGRLRGDTYLVDDLWKAFSL